MDLVTKWKSRLFRAWPNSGNWLALGQRIYMKANAVVKKDRVATTFFGSTMDCRIDDNIDRRIYFFGVYEPNLTHFMKRTIKKDNIVVDVGANIGYFTLLMSRLVEKDGLVVAIEASPSTFDRLTKNIKRDHRANVISRRVAVSDRKGEIQLFHSKYGDKDTGKISTIEQPGGTVFTRAPSDTLMNILTSGVRRHRHYWRSLKIRIDSRRDSLSCQRLETQISALSMRSKGMAFSVSFWKTTILTRHIWG